MRASDQLAEGRHACASLDGEPDEAFAVLEEDGFSVRPRAMENSCDALWLHPDAGALQHPSQDWTICAKALLLLDFTHDALTKVVNVCQDIVIQFYRTTRHACAIFCDFSCIAWGS